MLIFITIIIILLLIIYFLNGYYVLLLFNNLWELDDNPVFYNTNSEWCIELRNNYDKIRNEFLEYQISHKIPIYGEITQEQSNISDNQLEKWRVVILKMYGKETDLCKFFPITCSILKNIPGCHVSMFSILEPNKHIPKHKGVNKCVLRYHLGLIIPKDKEQCSITINNEKRFWEEGNDIMFDDTFEHFVENNTNEQRVVLFLDIQKKYNNIFLDMFNDIFFYLGSFNVTVKDIYNKVNSYE
jgi:beta-hydroxylase